MPFRTKLAILLWVSAATISLRYVFGDLQTFGEQQYLEYITPYISYFSLAHILVLALLYKSARSVLSGRTAAIALLISTIALSAPGDLLLTRWWLAIILLWAWSLATLHREIIHKSSTGDYFLHIIIILGLVEALIGLTQYALQHSLGLSLLGEPVANVETLGVAKVVVSGVKMLRPFGTFAHANVFGGFIVVSILALLSQRSALSRTVQQITLGILLFGVLFSYSRSAWIATVLICAIFMAKLGWRSFAAPIATLLIAAALFFPPLFSRFELNQNPQQLDVRALSTGYALESIVESPLGLGFRQFIPRLLDAYPDQRDYYYQPAHNVALLLASELGIFGFVLLIVIVAGLLRRYRATSMAIVVLLVLSLGSFDHYLVTLPQGLGILGLIFLVGLVPRVTATQSDQTF
ncbi:MAG: O-antigen ligase family protein [bacterium]|nr:O-antigen ligase family protein [bacterium]